MSVRKKIFLGIGSLLLIVVVYIGFTMLTTTSLSPFAVETYQGNDISMKIEYCRPYKKERLLFGSAEDDALQPHGQYWRLGANKATKLTLDTDIKFGGELLTKGSYSLYAFPNEDHWVIGINTESDRSGGSPPDFSKDVARIKVPVIHDVTSLEQFTISMQEEGGHMVLVMQWDKTQVHIPVESIG